jgi:hypothetical protein
LKVELWAIISNQPQAEYGLLIKQVGTDFIIAFPIRSRKKFQNSKKREVFHWFIEVINW